MVKWKKYIQTILPDINNYQYRFATEDDKKEYAVDSLEFKKKNELNCQFILALWIKRKLCTETS